MTTEISFRESVHEAIDHACCFLPQCKAMAAVWDDGLRTAIDQAVRGPVDDQITPISVALHLATNAAAWQVTFVTAHSYVIYAAGQAVILSRKEPAYVR